MGFEQPPIIVSPETGQIYKDINETRIHLLSYLSDDSHFTNANLNPGDKYEIEMRIDKIINLCETESEDPKLNSILSGVSTSYSKLKKDINAYPYTFGDIKDRISNLSEPGNADH